MRTDAVLRHAGPELRHDAGNVGAEDEGKVFFEEEPSVAAVCVVGEDWGGMMLGYILWGAGWGYL